MLPEDAVIVTLPEHLLAGAGVVTGVTGPVTPDEAGAAVGAAGEGVAIGPDELAT